MPHTPNATENGRFRMLSAGGVALRVYTRDLDRPGVPLVICNGLGQSVEILYPLLHELPDRPIIAFDAAGVGRSDVPCDVTTIPQHAAMLGEVLDQLGVGQFDVTGISWGGAVAQQITRDQPDRVRKLVLAITSAGGIVSWWGSPVALFEIMFPLRYANKAYGNFIGPFMYGGEAILQPALFREYTMHAIRPTYKGYAAQVQALCSWSSVSWLGDLKTPTQIIGGALDLLIPITNQMLLTALLPNARLRVFDAGHLVMYSRRAEVGALLAGFLDD
ncbi:alpha/beta hydrolase [Defluviimonas sp. WL0024]|uniref:Alpha/beta hydrolase n=1 Tax=Albidovulum salinarum TaxID=2984153 RepID=A0ABT2WYK7_9RHOB|nr:alpha/beta hydrolase [Defluviimonas sp. WL0024]MCU9846761.1 alpha/beta hydrolase [Defluviimonas sp. WL0024]